MGRKPKPNPIPKSNPNPRPTFLKVIFHDFATKLKIPPLFTKTYKERFYEKMVLKTAYGGSWVVKTEQVGQVLCFTKGWPSFVKYHKLAVGDCCLFWLNTDSTFDVAIYGRSCCDKELDNAAKKNGIIIGDSSIRSVPTKKIPTKSLKNEEDSTTGHLIRSASNRRSINHPIPVKTEARSNDVVEVRDSAPTMLISCAIVMRKYSKYYLSLPIQFSRDIGIVSDQHMLLSNTEERKWHVMIVVRRRSGDRVDITEGWYDFWRGNNITVGSTCVFEFIKNGGNLLKVKVLKR